MSDKINFTPKLIRKNRKGSYICIKEKIHEENNVTIINNYTKHKGIKFIKETLLQVESNTDKH